MRITVDEEVFDAQSRAEAVALLRLLTTAVDEAPGHVVLTNPLYAPAGNNGPVDTWLSNLNPHAADAFRIMLENSVMLASGPRNSPLADSSRPRRWQLPGPLEVRVQRRANSDWPLRILNVLDAADLLSEPVHLVMENARTELAFLRLLAGPTNGATLSALLDRPGRVVPLGGGGGEAKSWIDALTNGPQTAAKWRRMLRAWVLFDQDSGDPDARTPSLSALSLMESCEKVERMYGMGLPWICLRRREIESYIPDSGLHVMKTDRTRAFADQVIAWRADPALCAWAWALDLKSGLHGDRHPRWSHGLTEADVAAVKQGKKPLEAGMLKQPFSALPVSSIDTLKRGFGDAIGTALRGDTDPSWSFELPGE